MGDLDDLNSDVSHLDSRIDRLASDVEDIESRLSSFVTVPNSRQGSNWLEKLEIHGDTILTFHIDVGTMPPHKASAHIEKIKVEISKHIKETFPDKRIAILFMAESRY